MTRSALAVFAGLVVIALSATGTPAQDAGAEHVLTIAKADAFTSRAEKQLRPLAAYLEQQLTDVGIDKVHSVIAEDPVSLAQAMIDGNVDVVIDSPFPVMICRQRAQASCLLLGSQNGARTHRGLFFVRRDSGVESLSGLGGDIIAFENRTSTTQYFLPKLLLQSLGLSPRELQPDRGSPRSTEVGYVLAGSPLNISAWVYYGKVDAGVLSSAAWTEQAHNPEAYRREFRIIGETPETPRLIVAASDRMEAALRNRIMKVLLDMQQTSLGQAALTASGIDHFAELEPGTLSAFEALVSLKAGGAR